MAHGFIMVYVLIGPHYFRTTQLVRTPSPLSQWNRGLIQSWPPFFYTLKVISVQFSQHSGRHWLVLVWSEPSDRVMSVCSALVAHDPFESIRDRQSRRAIEFDRLTKSSFGYIPCYFFFPSHPEQLGFMPAAKHPFRESPNTTNRGISLIARCGFNYIPTSSLYAVPNSPCFQNLAYFYK